jgi:hypothetical protein
MIKTDHHHGENRAMRKGRIAAWCSILMLLGNIG